MANALLIAPLNAANFESGAAEAGQVLSADGSGGTTWETPAAGVTSGTGYSSAILVAGAGEASVNGIYLPAGTYGGKTKYVLVGGTNNERIEWGEWGDAWNIKADGTGWYYAYDAVDTPDLVETWSKDNGSSPVPTVVDYSSYPEGHVLTADGSGGATWEAPSLEITSQAESGTILVSGAGTASLNGVYRPVGVNNEKTSYALIGGSNGEGIEWQSGAPIALGTIYEPHWRMFDNHHPTAYYSLDDVATPDLATTWQIEDGAAPAPNAVEALANYPPGYVPAADGSGGAVWSPINAAVIRSEVAGDGHVLTADGAGGAAWEAITSITGDYQPAGSIRVVYAGHAPCNGIYEPDGEMNGKPSYRKVAGDNDETIAWTVDGEDSWWGISYDDDSMYFSNEDVATPDLVSVWEENEGALPAPIVTPYTNPLKNHVITADGEGGTRWKAPPFPQVVSSVEWGDALTAWNDISASQGVHPPPTDGLTPGASIYLTLRDATAEDNWALLEVHVDATYEQVATFVRDFAGAIGDSTPVEITSIAMALP